MAKELKAYTVLAESLNSVANIHISWLTTSSYFGSRRVQSFLLPWAPLFMSTYPFTHTHTNIHRDTDTHIDIQTDTETHIQTHIHTK